MSFLKSLPTGCDIFGIQKDRCFSRPYEDLERMSQISLTAPMRSNLLALQNIARQQDIVQNRLATGLKVSSAIDNPSAYYTAASLSNRAADLTALLDAMSQGIQTIKSASEAIDAGIKFLEQAKAVASQALESTAPVIARVSNEEELLAAVASGRRGLIVIDGDITLSENQTLTLNDGQSLVGKSYFGGTENTSLNFNFNEQNRDAITAANNSLFSNFTINYYTEARQNLTSAIKIHENQNVTIQNMNINFYDDYNYNGNEYFENAAILNYGSLTLKGTNNLSNSGTYRNYGLYITQNASTNINGILNIKTQGHNFAFGMVISISSICVLEERSSCNFNNPVFAFALSRGSQFISKSQTTINTNAQIYCGELPADSNYQNRIQLSSNTTINSTASVIFNLPKSYSSVCNILEFAADVYISWKYNDKQGLWKNDKEIIIDTVSNKRITPEDIYGMNKISDIFNGIPDIDAEMKKKKDNNKNNNLKDIYIFALSQYDYLISDASYKGINLLDGQKLKINFNEDRSSQIDVMGVKADSDSLGLKTKEWNSQEDIEKSISELESAINSLRSFASAFGNYYSIVITRQDFTENLINVLEEGADKLTLADMNEESANMLALQTSQQLAINSLSLASQAAQSVLKLF